ncbi:unnamed protein product [Bursaphelenchus okinawaensis]|uniref:Peptidase C1A papain C-terminal domain-containing protein n=1 Tax=Bursaphelenchus okinawaensis TaxID=465554 RepID=A0A811LRX0_9BILA|nr:unnamed protein product [Bursaphelenchus okinawaensis]CAG9127295.1 unnamed protein product [Bursaphelenchus okinawaensis]
MKLFVFFCLVIGASALSRDVRVSLKLAYELKQTLPEGQHADFEKFTEFIRKYERQYTTPEEVSQRFFSIQKSIKKVVVVSESDPMAIYGLTKLSDYSKEELKRVTSGLISESQNVDPSKYVILESEEIPEAFDWREHNGVTPVRDQGVCGSCYAFGSVAAIESQLLIHKNLSTYLSIEEILSCTYHNQKYGNNNGCHGGLPDGVYDFVKDNGITDNEHWEYDDQHEYFNGTCSEVKPVITKLEDVILLPPNNAESLKAALYTYGPVSARKV